MFRYISISGVCIVALLLTVMLVQRSRRMTCALQHFSYPVSIQLPPNVTAVAVAYECFFDRKLADRAASDISEFGPSFDPAIFYDFQCKGAWQSEYPLALRLGGSKRAAQRVCHCCLGQRHRWRIACWSRRLARRGGIGIRKRSTSPVINYSSPSSDFGFCARVGSPWSLHWFAIHCCKP